MSPLTLYILTVIKNDMRSHPNAYGSNHQSPMSYLMDSSRYHRDTLATEPIPWPYS